VRRRTRKDGTHAAVVAALRAAGCSVVDLSQLGGGVPDLLVGVRGRNVLLEVKAPDARGRISAGAARSSAGQADWARAWRGHPVHVVVGPDHALMALGLVAH